MYLPSYRNLADRSERNLARKIQHDSCHPDFPESYIEQKRRWHYWNRVMGKMVILAQGFEYTPAGNQIFVTHFIWR